MLGLLLTTQEAVKLIDSNGGSILNISSIMGPMPVPNASVYSATKAAVMQLPSRSPASSDPRKIRVNSLHPGMVETDRVHTAGLYVSDFRKTLESQTPPGRIAQPQNIARAAVFFASEDAG